MATTRYNFLQFLDGDIQIGEPPKSFHINKVEIPAIQRDYAQGRLNENKELNSTGKRFVDTIFDFLSGKDLTFELDFIYGSVEKEGETSGYKFTPLDGQQRLTTLFLLYWFIGQNELKKDQNAFCALMSRLARFSYATRTSARRFCEKLTEVSFQYSSKDIPSTFIRKQKWFRQAQEDDPTVNTMLNMLDAIHVKYVALKLDNLWLRLSYMMFYVQPLEDFNLTEELYVKMNARGKPLTALENFKAELVRWMTKEGGEQFQKKDANGYYHWLRIARKMDNDWLNNLFWKLLPVSEKHGADPAATADVLFYKFLCRYALMLYSLKRSEDPIFNKKPELDKTFAFLASEDDYRNLDAFTVLLSKEVFDQLEAIFDKLCRYYQEITKGLIPSWGTVESNDILFGDKIAQRERLIFYGVTCFLRSVNDFNDLKYRQWMRIVWNIAQNTDITDFRSMNGLLGLLDELSPVAEDIYCQLPTVSVQSNAGRLALREERIKCSFIQSNPEWENKFIELEKHPFFKGCIGYVLDEDITMDVFTHRAILLQRLFDNSGIVETYRDSNHLLLRAIISRYTSIDSLNEKHFVEIDENEHYLKKMLAEDEVTRCAIRQLVSQTDVPRMEAMMKDWIGQPSSLPDADPPSITSRYRFIHERLYYTPALQLWIQAQNASKKKILQIGWRYNRIFIGRKSSWYMWILIDGFRNELIDTMLQNSYSLTDAGKQCVVDGVKLPLFVGGMDEVLRLTKKLDVHMLIASIGREDVAVSYILSDQEERHIGTFEYQKSIADKNSISSFIKEIETKAQAVIDESSSNKTDTPTP